MWNLSGPAKNKGSPMTCEMLERAAGVLDAILRVVSDASRANASEEERREVLSLVQEGLQRGWIVVRAPQCTCGPGCALDVA